MKKILAILLALTMVVGLMSVSAWAATITVTQNPSTGTAGNESYVAYKVFDVTKTSAVTEPVTTAGGPGTAEGFAYSIDADSEWLSVVQGLKDADNNAYFTLTASADGTVYTVKLRDAKYNTEAYAKEIAGKLLAAIPTGVVECYSGAAGYNAVAAAAAIDKKYSFNTEDMAITVDDGYYLITSSLGTNLILATSNINIATKNEYIDDGKVAETASVTVGESATYYIVVNIPATVDPSKPIVVHDELPDELKFNNDLKALVQNDLTTYVPSTPVATLKEAQTYADLPANVTIATTGLSDSCDFEITILNSNATNNYIGKTIVFQYSAELLSSALSDTGYVNKEYTTYSDFETVPSVPEVKTYDIDIDKEFVGAAQGSESSLVAKFELRTAADDENTAIVIKEEEAFKKYVIADTTDKATVTNKTIQVNGTDVANIRGLGAGTYYLVETETAPGYNKLTSPVVVTVTDDGTITMKLDGQNVGTTVAEKTEYTQVAENAEYSADTTYYIVDPEKEGEYIVATVTADTFAELKSTLFTAETTPGSDTAAIQNNSGTVLPSTGGIGTTIFYIVGGLLAVGAGVVLVTKKRMSKEEN